MNCKSSVAILGSLFLALYLSLEATAQYPRASNRISPHRFESSRPTMSPFLNYFRQDTGVLNRYHAFVQPQRRNSTFSQLQNNRFRALKAETRQSSRQILLPTGSGSVFMNLSHFYQVRTRSRRR